MLILLTSIHSRYVPPILHELNMCMNRSILRSDRVQCSSATAPVVDQGQSGALTRQLIIINPLTIATYMIFQHCSLQKFPSLIHSSS